MWRQKVFSWSGKVYKLLLLQHNCLKCGDKNILVGQHCSRPIFTSFFDSWQLYWAFWHLFRRCRNRPKVHYDEKQKLMESKVFLCVTIMWDCVPTIFTNTQYPNFKCFNSIKPLNKQDQFTKFLALRAKFKAPAFHILPVIHFCGWMIYYIDIWGLIYLLIYLCVFQSGPKTSKFHLGTVLLW